MKPKQLAAGSIAAVFVSSVTLAQYGHSDGHLHLPPGNAPLVLALSTATSTASWTMSVTSLHNATHDADYILPADTTPLKSDGQEEVT